jgi:hypothetical protein
VWLLWCVVPQVEPLCQEPWSKTVYALSPQRLLAAALATPTAPGVRCERTVRRGRCALVGWLVWWARVFVRPVAAAAATVALRRRGRLLLLVAPVLLLRRSAVASAAAAASVAATGRGRRLLVASVLLLLLLLLLLLRRRRVVATAVAASGRGRRVLLSRRCRHAALRELRRLADLGSHGGVNGHVERNDDPVVAGAADV